MMIPEYGPLSRLTIKFKFQYNFYEDKVDKERFTKNNHSPFEHMVDTFKSILARSARQIGECDHKKILNRVPYLILCEEGGEFGGMHCHGLVFESDTYENIDYDHIKNMFNFEIRRNYLGKPIWELIPTLNDQIGAMDEDLITRWQGKEGSELRRNLGYLCDGEKHSDNHRSLFVKSPALEKMIREINEQDASGSMCDQSERIFQIAE
jgi:hypothetical protein